jgi:hypothetical protein
MRLDHPDAFRHFLRGLALAVLVQTVFMAGGLLVERLLDSPITGIPSMIGLTVVLVAGAALSRLWSPFVLMGSFTLAFVAPLVLFLAVQFRVFPADERLVFFSMGYLCALTLAVWFYFVWRVWTGDADEA